MGCHDLVQNFHKTTSAMIKPNSDPNELGTFMSASFPLSPPGVGHASTSANHQPHSPVFPFCFPNDAISSHSLSGSGKNSMDFLGYTSPRSYLDAFQTGQRQGETTRVEGSPDRSGWPTVVDSRIPFTTYFQNLTHTLRMAATKGATSASSNGSGTVSFPAASNSSSNHRTCASPANPCDFTPSPRTLSCGSQAEPDSSCCDDERNLDVKEDDKGADFRTKMVETEMNTWTNDTAEKKEFCNLKRGLSTDRGESSVQCKEKTTLPPAKKFLSQQTQFGRSLPCLMISPAQQTTQENSQTSLSAPVAPYSPLPTSPLPSLGSSLPYHFRLHPQYPLLRDSPDEPQQHLTSVQQIPSGPSSSGISAADSSVLSSSLPVSLLQYHLQEQQLHRHHHHQHHQQRHLQQHPHQQELRAQYPDSVPDGRLFLESALFQVIKVQFVCFLVFLLFCLCFFGFVLLIFAYLVLFC